MKRGEKALQSAFLFDEPVTPSRSIRTLVEAEEAALAVVAKERERAEQEAADKEIQCAYLSLRAADAARQVSAISLWQPWASAIAFRRKSIETRSWYTDYRGWLLIHAAKKYDREIREEVEDVPALRNFVRGFPYNDLGMFPRGGYVAAARLIACLKVPRTATYSAPIPGHPKGILLPPPEPERSFGGYDTTGGPRYAWVLADVLPISPLVPAKGCQGFWNPNHEEMRAVHESLVAFRAIAAMGETYAQPPSPSPSEAVPAEAAGEKQREEQEQ